MERERLTGEEKIRRGRYGQSTASLFRCSPMARK
jgi:hypothetical protein